MSGDDIGLDPRSIQAHSPKITDVLSIHVAEFGECLLEAGEHVVIGRRSQYSDAR
jgi:hypothetical protein